ncbi:CDP-diacylglycerol-inositol 3-phosphatidyltransferase [Linnemannia gamsii]|uniref:CDP-diacylglycerol--inositol 3-phosphatidyltransferase n=1 Tax=Linnemannia gamsii TaxID=64522 RepID=A0A9P6RH09_9FUNG|nr:CDP-diacylglycerol-inositol 3-phosphatidyltransferase [Linnemannia gamsii]
MTCLVIYSLSWLLGAVRQVSHYYNQCSTLAAALDVVTGVCTTVCLLCYLAAANPTYALVFQFLIALDASSHYMHIYWSLTSRATGHRVLRSSSIILRTYYGNNLILFAVCFGNELFFMILYLLSSDSHTLTCDKAVLYSLASLTGPVCAGKQIITCIQFAYTSRSLAEIDVEVKKTGKKT